MTIDGSFSDPALDLDTNTVTVDWGDGTAIETLAAALVDQVNDDFTASHIYTTGGAFTISVTVEDEDGGISDAFTTTAAVQGVGLINGTLYIVGTDNKDEVDIKLGKDGSGDGQQLKVKTKFDKMKKKKGGSGGSDSNVDFFDPDEVDQIIIHLCDGDDKVKINKKVEIDAEIHGGGGKDNLSGGGATTSSTAARARIS